MDADTKQAAMVKKIMLAKMGSHWKDEWRQSIVKLLEQIEVDEVVQSRKSSQPHQSELRLSFRHTSSVVILFTNEIEWKFQYPLSYREDQNMPFELSRDFLDLDDLPANLWYSLLFHVSEAIGQRSCKTSAQLYCLDCPALSGGFFTSDESWEIKWKYSQERNYDNQMWLPAQHYLKDLFQLGFGYVKPDTWFPSPSGRFGFVLDGQVYWSANLKLKLCEVLSSIQCEQIVSILYPARNDNGSDHNDNDTSDLNIFVPTKPAEICKQFLKTALDALARVTRLNSGRNFERFSKRHPLNWPAEMTRDNNDGGYPRDIYDYAFINPRATEVKETVGKTKMRELIAWIYTCFSENYDRIVVPDPSNGSNTTTNITDAASSSGPNLANWGSTFPTATDDFSDPLNLHGTLATTQTAQAISYFRDANSYVFNFLSDAERLSCRLPTAVANLTCEFIQFPSATTI